MTTLAIARRGRTIAIGADTLGKNGYTNIPASLRIRSSKLLRWKDNVFAFTGNHGSALAMECYLESLASPPRLDSELDVYRFLLDFDRAAQEAYQFEGRVEDAGEGYRGSAMLGLLANPSGGYAIFDTRGVMEVAGYFAHGAGQSFALGAMHATFSGAAGPVVVVRAGLAAAAVHCEDTGPPLEVVEIELDPSRSREPDEDLAFSDSSRDTTAGQW